MVQQQIDALYHELPDFLLESRRLSGATGARTHLPHGCEPGERYGSIFVSTARLVSANLGLFP